jgi:hypothetical protein
MKIEVFGASAPEEKRVRLKLVDYGIRCGVTLIAVDASGEEVPAGVLLTITHDGELVLHSSVSNEIGLALTTRGYLKAVRE